MSSSGNMSSERSMKRKVDNADLDSPPAQSSSASSTPSAVEPSTKQSSAESPAQDRSSGVPERPPSSLANAPNSSTAVVAIPSSADSANAAVQEATRRAQRTKQEEQTQRQLKSLKRRVRARIARQVGHEVDSDGEKEYWQSCRERDGVEAARRKALSPEERAREDFRTFITPRIEVDAPGRVSLEHYPLFFLQEAPRSQNGTTCTFTPCTDRIRPGDYRMTVAPGDNVWGSPNHYHVHCFEELLDLDSRHYLVRFESDRKHWPGPGAKYILEEYISRWKLRTKYVDKPKEVSSPQNEDPAQAAEIGVKADEASSSGGSAEVDVWKTADTILELTRQADAVASKQHISTGDLSQNDNAKDSSTDPSSNQYQSWHITQYLRPETDPDYDKRHALSQALDAWSIDLFLATTDESELDDDDRAGKEALGEMTIEQIKKIDRRWMTSPSYVLSESQIAVEAARWGAA